jgi:hypothetical protein
MLAASTSPPPPDPYALFSQTRAAMTAARYPERIDYTIGVSGFDGSVFRTNHYRASDRAQLGVDVAAISAEEAATWHVPQGVNVKFEAVLYGVAIVVPLGRTPASLDLLGVPILTPTYSFGLRYPPVTVATTHAAPGDASIPVIAVVSSRARNYTISLAGIQTIDDTQTYDLRLTPLRDPKNNRLRELWVGIGDHLPRRATVAGNFTLAPLTDVPWTIDFTVVDGLPYVARELADASLFMPHRQVVRNAQIAFEDIREGASFMNSPLIAPDRSDTDIVEPAQ